MDAPASIEIGLIYPRRNGRPVDKRAIAKLAASIEAMGLQTPITVRPSKRTVGTHEVDAYEIVAGRHRFEAALSLKWQRINAFVQTWDDDDAQLWEIDENLIRAELGDAQRAEHHARRRDLLAKRGLVSAPGRGGDRRSKDKLSLGSYPAETAKTLGVSEKTVKRDLARGTKIAPPVLAEIAGTDLDKGAVLDQVAKVAPAKQAAFVADLKAKAAAPKAERARRAEPVHSLADRQAEPILKAWNAAPQPGRERFLELIGATFSQRSVA